MMDLSFRSRSIQVLLITILALALASCSDNAAFKQTMPDSFVTHPGVIVPNVPGSPYQSRSFQGIPAIAKTGSRLWAAWYGAPSTNPASEGPGNFVIVAYTDDGMQWQESFYIVPQAAESERVFDPQLWVDPVGRLWIFYAQSGKGMVNDNLIGAWASIITNPLDIEPNVTTGVFLANGVPASPFLIDGQWSMFINYWNVPTPARPELVGKNLYSLDWQNSRVTFIGKPDTTSPAVATFDETTAVQLLNRHILAQWRTAAGINYAVSTDSGVHWTVPTIFSGVTPQNNSRHVLARHPISGRLIIVLNRNQYFRTDLTVAASDDEGITWPYQYDFEPQNNVSYPAIVFDDNGDLLIIYDEDRSGTGKIKLARISESDLVAGNPNATISVISALSN
ncbi:MAG TPA: sialidase family protein [Geobacteraceae bacterium]